MVSNLNILFINWENTCYNLYVLNVIMEMSNKQIMDVFNFYHIIGRSSILCVEYILNIFIGLFILRLTQTLVSYFLIVIFWEISNIANYLKIIE